MKYKTRIKKILFELSGETIKGVKQYYLEDDYLDKYVERIQEATMKVINVEPSALIPRTMEHLEAYRKKQEIRQQFREQLKDELGIEESVGR